MLFTRRHCFAVLSLLLVFSLPAMAQVSAALSGRVTDQTGAGVPGATVTAKDTELGVSRVTVTDDAGRYELPSLPLGKYEVDATKKRDLRQPSAKELCWSWVRMRLRI